MDIINIIGTLFDNSINHVVALANQIRDSRLNKNQQDINEDIYNQIGSLNVEQINSNIDDINQNIRVINQQLGIVNPNDFRYTILTEEEYDALDSYDDNTIYFVKENGN